MLTVYGFSTENWKRDKTEISLLLDLCVYFAQSELAELIATTFACESSDNIARFPRRRATRSTGSSRRTAGNDGLALNLAVNYSARAELRIALEERRARRCERRARPRRDRRATVARYLSTADMPDPDLLIRPGGESRLSNFLLYQLADAELYLTDTFWPDFDRAHFVRALDDFRRRAGTAGGA